MDHTESCGDDKIVHRLRTILPHKFSYDEFFGLDIHPSYTRSILLFTYDKA